MSATVFSMVISNIILLVLGQTLWKIGLRKIEFTLTPSGILGAVLNPFIFAGLCIYAAATIIWFYVLSKSDISAVYPIQSLCYVIAALTGVFILGENVSAIRWVGLACISMGAVLVARG